MNCLCDFYQFNSIHSPVPAKRRFFFNFQFQFFDINLFSLQIEFISCMSESMLCVSVRDINKELLSHAERVAISHNLFTISFCYLHSVNVAIELYQHINKYIILNFPHSHTKRMRLRSR
jgi:hypothetical protein